MSKAAEGAQAAMEKAADVGAPAHKMWRLRIPRNIEREVGNN